MEDEIDFELGEHALENPLVGDRSRELAAHLARQCRLERCDIDGDDRSSRLREAIDEAVPYFPARPRHEHGRSAHLAILYFRWFVGSRVRSSNRRTRTFTSGNDPLAN